MDPMQGSYI